MRVSTNTQALAAYHNLQHRVKEEEVSSMKLSSGERIYQAAVDPSGMAISQTMRAKIKSFSQAERNTNDGLSLVQVAEGVLDTIHMLTNRLRELALTASTDTVNDGQRMMADVEYQQLKTEISRLTESSQFNGNPLLNDQGSVYELQVGTENSKEYDRIKYDMKKVLTSLGHLGINSTNVKTKNSAQYSLDPVMGAISKISGSRADLGAVSNRMVSVINTLQLSRENFTASESRVRDADIAYEASNKLKNSIAKEATNAMLVHANHAPAMILKLV